MGVSQTPGLSGSAVVLLDQGAPVLHSHERPLFRRFYDFMPAAARRRASCLTDSAERRRVRCSCDAPCAVLFPGSSIRHPHERGCHSGAAASIPAMTAMNVTAMQRRSTGAEKNTNMVASTLLAQIASVKRRPRVLGVGDQNQSPKCGALEPHTRQTPTDNEFTRPRGSVPSAGLWRPSESQSARVLGALESGADDWKRSV